MTNIFAHLQHPHVQNNQYLMLKCLELWRHVSIYTICSWTTQLPVIDFHFSNALRMHHFAYEYHFFGGVGGWGGNTLQLAIQSQNAPFCLKKNNKIFRGADTLSWTDLSVSKCSVLLVKSKNIWGVGYL